MKPNIRSEKQAELARLLARLGIREDDFLEKFIRASGPGGQKVNKTASAVYLKHIPSGMEVKVQSSRSQVLNRFEARRLLAKRLEAQILGKQSAEAERIEKIRRQKRKRSKRAKERILADKHEHAAKKMTRKPPKPE